MRIHVLNTGGTLGMTGKPLRPAKSAVELLEDINIPKDVELSLYDFEKRQDSTNISHSERVQMAEIIAAAYDDHDSFIILHGTDSLGLTTAALSIIWKRSLQKSIFVIGAQMSKDEPGSDVSMQLANTMRVAESFHRNKIVGVYSVCIGDVLHGGRIMKRRESDPNAFHTPGMQPVAQCWPQILLRTGLRYKDPERDVLGQRLDTQFEPQVATYKVSADIPPWVLMDLVRSNRLKGAILECRGAGQIPDRKWMDLQTHEEYSWIDVIREATAKQIYIGILSPFEDGRVILNRYELGDAVYKAGAISLESLTPDMADVKFRQAIAMFPNDRGSIQKFISTDLTGGELLSGLEDRK